MENQPRFAKGFTAALQEAIDGIAVQISTDPDEPVQGLIYLGEINLSNGRTAQIQLMVTDNPDLALEPEPLLADNSTLAT